MIIVMISDSDGVTKNEETFRQFLFDAIADNPQPFAIEICPIGNELLPVQIEKRKLNSSWAGYYENPDADLDHDHSMDY